MPSVIEKGAKEGLIHRPSLEQVGVVLPAEAGGREHIAQRIDVVLEPKVVGLLHVLLRLHRQRKGHGLTSADDDVVGVHSVGRTLPHGTAPRPEFPEEPFAPIAEAIVRQFREADEFVISYLLAGRLAEPTVGLLLIHEFEG